MTQNDPEVLRAEIARTRAELSDNVDTLTDTANPKNIATRQKNKVKSAVQGVREHLMGAPDDPDDRGTIGDTAGSVKGRAVGTLGSAQDHTNSALASVSDTPAQIRRKARGNPVAAGLIAFGIGYLISAAIPTTEREQDAASRLQDKAAPLQDKLREAASEVTDRLREPAQDALDAVKETTTGAVANVKDEGAAAKDDVQNQVQKSSATVKGSATS